MNGWVITSLDKGFDAYLMRELRENKASANCILVSKDPLTIKFVLKSLVKKFMVVSDEYILAGIYKGMEIKYPDFKKDKDYKIEMI